MSITIDDLKDYHTTKGPVIGNPHAIALHQKRVREGDYTLYFIDILQYDVSYLPSDCHDRYRLSCKVTLYLPNTFMEVTLPMGDYDTIEALEGFIHETYIKLECVPDWINN